MAGPLQALFGDDLEDTFDSLLSVPGAFGNITVGVMRQLRPYDALLLTLVVAGLVWLVGGYGVEGDHQAAWTLLALLPIVLWFACGLIGGLVFELAGIGRHALAYWESYLLIGLFACFGSVSLRLALNPRDILVHRGP